MMQGLLASVYKEGLLLLRDRGGLAVLFLMPAILIIVMVFIQDPTFREFQESDLEIILVDADSSGVSEMIRTGLSGSAHFRFISDREGRKFTAETAAAAVRKGRAKAAIILPEGLQRQVDERIARLFTGEKDSLSAPLIQVYYDPVLKASFRNLVQSGLREISARLESYLIMNRIMIMMPQLAGGGFDLTRSLSGAGQPILQTEIRTAENGQKVMPNSVQHNVPGWTMFAMFFLVIPMSSNIIKEREDGSLDRLRTLPISISTILAGKMMIYLFVCLLQTAMLIGLGKYFFSLWGFAPLQMGHSLPALANVVLSSALAAIGYGLLIGYTFKTHQQAAAFGAISVIIAAAVGGIWVPVFIMPEMIRLASGFSPLNWGLNAFHDVFLHDANFKEVMINSLKLFVFFAFSLAVAMIKLKTSVR